MGNLTASSFKVVPFKLLQCIPQHFICRETDIKCLLFYYHSFTMVISLIKHES